MGLKQLLIILVLFGTGTSLYSFIGALIVFVVAFLNISFRRFWSEEKNIIFGILFSGLIASLLFKLGKIIDYRWAIDNKLFIYSLPIIPIVLLEYKETRFLQMIKELLVYIDAFVFIGLLKELIVKGSIFGIKILSNYEGLLIFDNNSGTLLLIGITMIIAEFLKVGAKK